MRAGEREREAARGGGSSWRSEGLPRGLREEEAPLHGRGIVMRGEGEPKGIRPRKALGGGGLQLGRCFCAVVGAQSNIYSGRGETG